MRHEQTSTAAAGNSRRQRRQRERELRSRSAAFLRAERADDVSASEVALRGLFRALPSPMPSAEFAARVMAASGVAMTGAVRPAVRRVRDLAPRHRWLVAAAALCLAVASAYLLPLVVIVLGQIEWGALVAGIGALFGHLVSWLHALAPFCRAALSLIHAFWLFLSSPQVLLTLVIATSVVGVCVRLLTEMIHSPQDPAHASL